jgi:hypothetical protein
MREMDRKDFDLPFIPKFILVLTAMTLPAGAVLFNLDILERSVE